MQHDDNRAKQEKAKVLNNSNVAIFAKLLTAVDEPMRQEFKLQQAWQAWLIIRHVWVAGHGPGHVDQLLTCANRFE